MEGITIQENPLQNNSISISGLVMCFFFLLRGQMQTI